MKKLFLLLLIINWPLMIVHGEDIKDVFTTMPDSLLPLLTEKNRHDMVDFYQNKMEAKVRNRLNDYVRLDTLTDSYLRLTLSRVSSLEMKLLETTDSVSIICLVRTLSAPASDSQVEFYNRDWQRLHWLALPVAKTQEYFAAAPDSVSRDLELAQRSLDDLRLVSVTVAPDQPIFTLQVATDELERDAQKLARRYVRALRYRWTGSDFERFSAE